MGCFVENIGAASTFDAELSGAIKVIEHIWTNLWLETLWYLRNIWNNCKALTCNVKLLIFHILREEKRFTNTLSNLSLTLPSYTFLNELHLVLLDCFRSNRLDLPNFKYISHWKYLDLPPFCFCNPFCIFVRLFSF